MKANEIREMNPDELDGELENLEQRLFEIRSQAVTEKLEVKQDIFRRLESICAAETLFATNTSSLSITAIASSLKDPSRWVGMHFFNPAPAMKLVDQGYIYGVISQNSGLNTIAPLDLAYEIGIKGNDQYPEICTVPSMPITKDGGEGRWKATDFAKMMWVDYEWDMHFMTPEEFK